MQRLKVYVQGVILILINWKYLVVYDRFSRNCGLCFLPINCVATFYSLHGSITNAFGKKCFHCCLGIRLSCL